MFSCMIARTSTAEVISSGVDGTKNGALQLGFIQSSEVHIFGYAQTKISDDELRNRIRGLFLLAYQLWGGGSGWSSSSTSSASAVSSVSSSIYFELWHACAGPLTSLPKKANKENDEVYTKVTLFLEPENNVAKLLEIALDDEMDKEPNVPLPCLEVSLLELLCKNVLDKYSKKHTSDNGLGVVSMVSRAVGAKKKIDTLLLSDNQETRSTSIDCDATFVDEDEDEDDGTSDGELGSVDRDDEDDDIQNSFKLSIPAGLRDGIAVVLEDLDVESRVLGLSSKLIPVLKKAYKSGSLDLKIKSDLKSHLASGSLVKSLPSVNTRGRVAA
ncbi:hypothetical protein GIB67_037022 [Kingdonia uniflora]|uniref:Uncharacterized protein n=1 Tax=Kingdonia uniflora TaxID=39325 RepID=A0A7J7LHX2_9MAGN|nr:hypothetical protein GIB67_037022 [Kingdonia uniflora]